MVLKGENSSETENYAISEHQLVTLTKMNHISEIQFLEKMNTRQVIKKISKDKYLNLDTGEIKEFKKAELRIENTSSLYKTFKKLRYLINNNFTGSKNELFVTLTYGGSDRPTLKDSKRIYKDFTAMNRRLKKKYGSVDFLRVLEPHEDGHAHLHVLFRFNDLKKIYISNDDFSEMWRKGFVTIHSLKDVDNIGAYVSAYLADIELTEKTVLDLLDNSKEVIEKEGKKFIKGGRLKYYPVNTQIYNKSKGILEPERIKMSYKKAKKIAGAGTPTYEKTLLIEKEEFSNTIKFEHFNSRRV